jgi:glutamyl endopeptidase
MQVHETEEYPFRAIASLLITAKDGSPWVGTGWFSSLRTLITAGRCVADRSTSIGELVWTYSVRSDRAIPARWVELL